MLYYLFALIGGPAATLQASVNAEAGKQLRSPYLAAAINFCVSISLLIPIILIVDRNLYIPLSEIAQKPIWIWGGGVCGIIIIMMGILCVPVLGSGLNMMLACTSQILAGLIIDHFGMFGASQIAMTPVRFAGAALVMLGIIIPALKREKSEGTSSHKKWIFVILSLVNGTAAAVQVAVNGSLTNVIGAPMKATLISMCVGLTSTLIVIAALRIIKGRNAIFDGRIKPDRIRLNTVVLIGGAFAIGIVGGNAIAAPHLGTGIVTIMNLTGMMITGLILDMIGFLGIEKKAATFIKIAGIVLIIAVAALISF